MKLKLSHIAIFLSALLFIYFIVAFIVAYYRLDLWG